MAIVFGTPEANRMIYPELKPCPFCGGTHLIGEVHDGISDKYYIECGACHSRSGARAKLLDARRIWNLRTENEVTK